MPVVPVAGGPEVLGVDGLDGDWPALDAADTQHVSLQLLVATHKVPADLEPPE